MRQISTIYKIFYVLRFLSLVILSIGISSIGKAEDSTYLQAESGSKIELDLATVIRAAIQLNRDIDIARFDPEIAQEGVKKVDSLYDLTTFSKAGITRTDRPTQTILDTGSEELDKLLEDRWLVQVGVKKQVSTGGSISIYQELDYLDSNSEFVEPNPQKTSRLRVGIEQPLLKNIGDQENKAAKETALTNVATAKEQVQITMTDIVYKVTVLYWQLQLGTRLNEIHSRNLNLAKDIWQQEQERMSIGISKQIDVDRAVSAIETRRSRLIRSINEKKLAFHQLRFIVNAPTLFAQGKEIETIPTEEPVTASLNFTVTSLLDEALKKRPEVKIAKHQLETAEVNKKLYYRLQLPQLNARADYTLNSLADDAGNAVSKVYEFKNDGWAVWLDFEYPLGSNGPEAQYRQAELTYRQAQRKVAHARDAIIQEINSTAEEVASSYQQLEAAKTAKDAADRLLQSEMANYEISRTTNKDLLQAQDVSTLATVEYYNALSYYNMKLAQLNRARGTTLDNYVNEL